MKKLLSILSLVTIFGITSCGPTTSTPTVDPTSDPTTSEPTSATTDPTTIPSVPTTEAEPDTYEFHITVEYEDGTPFVGARVQACTEDNSQCFMPVTTDEEGKAILVLELGSYYVHVINVPEGYYYDEDGYLINEENASCTIVLYQEQVARQRSW